MKQDIKNTNRSLRKQVASIVGVFSFTILTGTVLSSTTAKADVIDPVVATVTTSCTLAGTGTLHSATLTSGVLTKDIGTTTLTVTCNDAGGFGIYAVGYSSDTEGTTALISGAGSTYNIATGTATSGDTSNWAMKVTPGTDTTSVNDFNAYHAVPANYTRVVEKASGVDRGTTAAATTTYQVYPNIAQAAGAYIGKVKYTLAHPSTEECPEGYTMHGGVCKLIMQNVATWGKTLTTNQSVQALDSRDNKTYWVTKLADGNIWMTQNLDLDLNANTLPLTSATSDVSANWTPGSTYYTKTATSSSSTNTDMYSWDLGDYVYDGTTNSSCGDSATSYADCTSYGFSLATSLAADSAQRHYHVGNNYQWNAATAGTGGTITSGEATDSICPKGWRLPTSNTGGEFQALVDAYSVGSTVQTLINSPLYFVRGGYVLSGTLRFAGFYGRYWSSTPDSDSSLAYFLGFGGTSSVNPSGNGSRYFGFSVRCVAGS